MIDSSKSKASIKLGKAPFGPIRMRRAALLSFLCRMIRKGVFMSMWCALGLWGAGAFGQPTDTQDLALHHVLERALQHSVQARKAYWESQASALRMQDQRRQATLPKLQFSASMDYVPALPTTFLPAALFGGVEGSYIAATLGQPWQTYAGVRLEQPLFDEAARRLAPAATLTQSLQDLMVRQAEEEILFQTANLFYQTLQARALIRALEANRRQLQQLERMAQLSQENAQGTPSDVQRLQAALATLDAQRQELEGNIAALYASIQFLCGLPFEQPIRLIEEALDTSQWSLLPPSSIEQSIPYRLLDGRLSLLNLQERSVRAQGLPKVGLYAQAGLLSQRTDARFAAADGRWYPLGLVGLRMDWPLLEGPRQRYHRELLRLQVRQSEEERDYFTRAWRLEQMQARMQWESALRTLSARAQGVQLARRWAEQAQLIYREGSSSLREVISAQTALAEAETQYEQQLFTCRLAEVKWLKATGQIRTLLKEKNTQQ